MPQTDKDTYYSDKYYDDTYEYRHVILAKEMVPLIPKNRLMIDKEWRAIGVCQSEGWVHYMIHKPEPHILLFRRPLKADSRKIIAEQKEKEELHMKARAKALKN